MIFFFVLNKLREFPLLVLITIKEYKKEFFIDMMIKIFKFHHVPEISANYTFHVEANAKL